MSCYFPSSQGQHWNPSGHCSIVACLPPRCSGSYLWPLRGCHALAHSEATHSSEEVTVSWENHPCSSSIWGTRGPRVMMGCHPGDHVERIRHDFQENKNHPHKFNENWNWGNCSFFSIDSGFLRVKAKARYLLWGVGREKHSEVWSQPLWGGMVAT